MIARMKIQLICLMFLTFTSQSLCSDSEEEMKALEADLLTNMYTSKISKARFPHWKMTLINVCNLVNNLNSQVEETGETGDDELVMRRQFSTLDGFNLEAMLTIYQLQKICQSRVFQHWEEDDLWAGEDRTKMINREVKPKINEDMLLQDDILETGNLNREKEEVMKRKTPYILKRQIHVNKARRPYILKRSSSYY
ncbi:neurotensin/neuromedin N isoform X1 [Monodelphis domestica]|uniref:neurotensin/neuromedin N isoform X1 n=1 Tax=Monodelphis domestica TaxID=13616 RepID=UPI0024E27682|nr:neurotensin/neuromedin N isoform X1 [Monodelphis domestica]